MTVYKLAHQRHIEYKLHTAEWVTDCRVIGFFSTREEAERAADSLRCKPGFAELPEYFTVDPYEVDGTTDTVYYVQHSYYIIDERVDNIVEVGVFATEAEAMAAAADYENTARIPVGTHSWDEDLDIDNYLSVAAYSLNESDWQDGFVPG